MVRWWCVLGIWVLELLWKMSMVAHALCKKCVHAQLFSRKTVYGFLAEG